MSAIRLAVFMFAGMLVLQGCSSVSGLREKSPDVMLDTQKSPSQYGQCVATSWGEFFGRTVNQGTLPGGGYTINLPSVPGGSDAVLDATPKDGGAHVEIRYRLSSLGGYTKYTRAAHDCQ